MQLTGARLDPDDSFQGVTQHLRFKFDCKPTDHTTCFELADTLRDAGPWNRTAATRCQLYRSFWERREVFTDVVSRVHALALALARAHAQRKPENTSRHSRPSQ